ncbi:GNAT family N-acetyltransferase [Rubrimonas sp.]|uniref:GNAT family N-acetyltransferase n=1 Tax=Rubrimonas sp. TaxID=2036015 RepID=UPI002FDCCC0F
MTLALREPALPAIPVIETERLRLRAPRLSDFDAYAAFCASPRSAGVGGPYSRGDAFQRFAALIGHWALRGFGRFMVADRASDAPLGVVGPMHPIEWPEPEIAWSVFDHAEGRGVAHEAALAARRFAYETLRWSTAVSLTAPDNLRSQALARRLGCERDGVFEHPEFGALLIWRHPAPEAAR